VILDIRPAGPIIRPMPQTTPIAVALYGSNGHQVHNKLVGHPHARMVAVCDCQKLFDAKGPGDGVRTYATLAEMLKDDRAQLVTLCSPRRDQQAADAIACLRGGKHVLAEKPCAMNEEQLDQILAEAKRAGREFHEMADTRFYQPYRAMHDAIASGAIGNVVQIIAQKCYPHMPTRPGDEGIDGGLTMQAGIHAVRMIEHVAQQRIKRVECVETRKTNPSPQGNLMMATAMMFELQSGGIATATANYLNVKGTGVWGYEMLRIFGDKGMIESDDGGRRHRLVVGDHDRGSLDTSEPSSNMFDVLCRHLSDGSPLPFSEEEEFSPTRWVIRAKRNARRADVG
jgi:predicted dehydrogenase